MNKTSIEWTDYTWNPIRARLKTAGHYDCDCPCEACADGKGHCGRKPCDAHRSGTFCTRISPGCQHCYASTINMRFGTGLEYTVPNLEKHEFFIDERILEEPLRRKKPARIFVGDMFDLFHEAIPDELIWEVIITATSATQHTFQFLTKRARRMQMLLQGHYTPMSNHWFGTSVEDKQRAYERIPQLQMTPAAIRFLSIEPQLEEVPTGFDTPELGWLSWLHPFEGADPPIPRIDWVICGGESGPGARPFNLEWAESLLAQCRAAGVPFFMKQIGSHPVSTAKSLGSPDATISWPCRVDRKGGDPSEWPEALRVREFPSQKAEACA